MRPSLPSVLSVFLLAWLSTGCASEIQNQHSILPNLPNVAFRAHSSSLGKRSSQQSKYAGLKALYVGDTGTGAVEVLSNGKYRDIGVIRTGVDYPGGIALDTSGNLYVANQDNATVAEYAPGSSVPMFTYSAAMENPINVAVDGHGNVFEVDDDFTLGTFVNEYFQGLNETVGQGALPTGSIASGVAVDSQGDVFVSYNGTLGEFVGGLNAPLLTIPVSFPGGVGGIALDKNRDLVVCDIGNRTVDVLTPPYLSITRTIGSGFDAPANVTLNKTNSEAFVTDYGSAHAQATVVNYATGANITTLDAKNGLSRPLSIVDGPEAVY